ncbi:MAG: hypothetical protein L0219_05935 [Phycisphaerales bacterium]|nr:hypothetical protein [Phycisphaerales bacterium]
MAPRRRRIHFSEQGFSIIQDDLCSQLILGPMLVIAAITAIALVEPVVWRIIAPALLLLLACACLTSRRVFFEKQVGEFVFETSMLTLVVLARRVRRIDEFIAVSMSSVNDRTGESYHGWEWLVELVEPSGAMVQVIAPGRWQRQKAIARYCRDRISRVTGLPATRAVRCK